MPGKNALKNANYQRTTCNVRIIGNSLFSFALAAGVGCRGNKHKRSHSKVQPRRTYLYSSTPIKYFVMNSYLNILQQDNEQICRYGQILARAFKCPDTVGNYKSVVRTFIAVLGMSIPNPQVKNA